MGLLCVLKHWDRDKMVDISQTTFPNAFSWMKIYEFRLIFHWNLILRFKLTNSSIGSDNGLALNRRQAIIWTNDGKFTDAYMRHPASVIKTLQFQANHDDVKTPKRVPHYWPFVNGIHWYRWNPLTKASDAEQSFEQTVEWPVILRHDSIIYNYAFEIVWPELLISYSNHANIFVGCDSNNKLISPYILLPMILKHFKQHMKYSKF